MPEHRLVGCAGRDSVQWDGRLGKRAETILHQESHPSIQQDRNWKERE